MATEETFDESASNDPTFVEASVAARANPSDDAAWDTLEDWAGATQRPDDVSALYRAALNEVTSAAVGGPLAQRALNFHEEWFGEDAPQIIEVLERATVALPDEARLHLVGAQALGAVDRAHA